MFRMLIHPSSGVCDLFVGLCHGLYCSGTMCVGVTLWSGWGGVVSGCRLDVTCLFISLFHAQHVSDVNTSILRSLRLICWVMSWVVLLWYDVCWCYVLVWLGWCGIRMQASALATYLLSYVMGCIAVVRCVLVLRFSLAGVVWYPDAGFSPCDLFVELCHGLYYSGTMCVGVTV